MQLAADQIVHRKLSDPEFEAILQRTANKARTDFVSFLYVMFPQTPDQRYKIGKVHRWTANLIQDILNGVTSPSWSVSMPPQHGKSRLIAVRAVAWAIGAFPRISIALTGFSHTLLTEFIYEMNQIVETERYRSIFPGVSSLYGRNRQDFKQFSNGSSVLCKSSGCKLTGRRVDLLIIDDALSGRAEAESPSAREHIKQWYFADCLTRLSPNAKQFVIACMVGSTPVLMEDGTQKPLAAVRAGDRVVSYDNGKLCVSTVLNWANQGSDCVFAIRTRSGIEVAANGRHPFLVERSGIRQWVKLKNLAVSDTLIRVSGVGGEASFVVTMDVKSLPCARGSVILTTTKQDGQQGNALHHTPTSGQVGRGISSIGMGSMLTNTTGCCSSREGVVQSVEISPLTQPRLLIGKVGCVSITVMSRSKFVDFCAIHATSSLEAETHPRFCSGQSNTYEAIPDEIVEIREVGREDVFDIEVERTENFIAGGLVSHNTRWHKEDLIGSLTDPEYVEELRKEGHHDRIFNTLNFPAVAEDDNDALGRMRGDPLFPQERPLAFLQGIRAALPEYEWQSQYQGNPQTARSGQVNTDKLVRISLSDVPKHLERFRGWDLALTIQKASNYSAGPLCAYDKDKDIFYILDMFHDKLVWPKLKPKIVSMALADKREHGLQRIGMEAVAGFIIGLEEVRKELLGEVRVECRNPMKDKLLRAQPWLNKIEAGKVCVVKGEWNRKFFNELIMFPDSENDDQVDGVSICWEMATQRQAIRFA